MAEHVFTDDEIRQIIDVINRTKHTQYIGARYVPVFGRVGEDSIEWNNSAPYEPLTIVLHQGNSYTSRQYVPAGVEITNEKYWANTGNYNAQVEQYRQDVLRYDSRITAAQDSADNAKSRADSAHEKLSAMGVNSTQDGTDFLTRVDGIDTRTTLDSTILDELGVSTVQDATALKKNLHNAVLLGIDNTGSKDVGADINALYNEYDVIYFPAGTYKIDTLVTLVGKSIVGDAEGTVFTTSKPTPMFNLRNDDKNQVSITDCVFDGNWVCKTPITGNCGYTHITNCVFRYFTDTQLDLSQQHAARVSNVYLLGDRNNTGGHITTGLKTNYDSQFDNIRIWETNVGIDTTGLDFFTNIYMFSGTSSDRPEEDLQTSGFKLRAQRPKIRGASIYIDGYYAAFDGYRPDVDNYYNLDMSINSLEVEFNVNNRANVSSDNNPIIYRVGSASRIDVGSMWFGTSSENFFFAMNDMGGFFQRPVRLGVNPYGNTTTKFEYLCLNPKTIYNTMNVDYNTFGIPATQPTYNVNNTMGIPIFETDNKSFCELSLRNEAGDYIVDELIVNGYSGECKKHTFYNYQNRYTLYKNTVDHKTTIYIVPTSETDTAVMPIILRWKNNERTALGCIAALNNTTAVTLPGTAQEIQEGA